MVKMSLLLGDEGMKKPSITLLGWVAVLGVLALARGAGADPYRVPGGRVNVTADDKRKKDGHTVSVNLSAAQAAAFDILKEFGTVIIELHKARLPKSRTRK
jgi:hypothetical protein